MDENEGVKDYNIDLPSDIHNLAHTLHVAGGKPYISGGIVRDAVMGKTDAPKDYDMEVHGMTPDHIISTMKNNGFKVSDTQVGKSFGVVKVHSSSGHVDIGVPREDTAGRKPDVNFLKNVTPKQASSRRDFTMNSMLYDPIHGKLHDPHGGEADIKNKVIRSTNPNAFHEDPLRVLRAAQFSARYNFDIHPDTIESGKKADLSGLPGERIKEELEKSFTKSQKPSKFFESMHHMEQLHKVFPEVHSLRGVGQNIDKHPEGDVYQHTMDVVDRLASSGEKDHSMFYAGLLHDTGKPFTRKDTDGKVSFIDHEKHSRNVANSFLKRMKVSNDVHEDSLNIVEHHMLPHAMAMNKATGMTHKNRALVKIAGSVQALRNNPEKSLQRYGKVMNFAKIDNDNRDSETYNKISDMPHYSNYVSQIDSKKIADEGHVGPAFGKRYDELYYNQISGGNKNAIPK